MRYLFVVTLLLLSFSCSNSVDEKRIIDSNKFNEFISKKDKTLVYIWTTWCSGCRKSLEETLPKLIQDIKADDYQLLMIAVSKNKEEVDSLVGANGLSSNSYLLDFIGPDKGKFQSVGIRQFLSSNFPNEKIFTGGIPVFFLVSRDKEVLVKKLPHTYDEVMEILE
ncbi:TlpA family protein disulfide reductase [Marinifilum sp. D737]|uniref:TlpA family protein disulfide reductase n=1 Tax=Marinifilum sp. D737 TaxID=2969628 RepID=UPI0022724D30|nr:redoxin family protein [Marinifilum sp. D737]MCY1635805.1 thioredoxin-like domain-containing protein [Marinifilum sp. D737]